jgi:nitronate monooxygenase
VLRNSTIEAWEAAGHPASGARPGEGEALAATSRGSIPRYASATPGPDAKGQIEALSLWAGQGVGQLHREQPAAEVVREIAGEARAVLKTLAAELDL